MEPAGSLPCLQQPGTGSQPKPDALIHTFPSYFPKMCIDSILYLLLGLPSGLFPSGFATNILYTFLFSPMLATWSARL